MTRRAATFIGCLESASEELGVDGPLLTKFRVYEGGTEGYLECASVQALYTLIVTTKDRALPR